MTDISSEEVLAPIPMNFVDMALAKVNQMSKNPMAAQPPQLPQPTPRPPVAPAQSKAETVICNSEPSYFKDPLGNEYRLKDGKLYVKGWKDIDKNVRVVRTSNERPFPMDGKKVQIYGWILLKNAEKDEISELTDDEMDLSEEC